LVLIAANVPKTFGLLEVATQDLLSFGLSFSLMMVVWYTQHLFFRRYGTEDGRTTALNVLLLFAVLFGVFPLKMGCDYAVRIIVSLLRGTDYSEAMSIMEPSDLRGLLLIFGSAYFMVATALLVLFMHAIRLRAELDLSPKDLSQAQATLAVCATNSVIAMTSLAAALKGSPKLLLFACAIYPAALPVSFVVHRVRSR
jgi:uncharacterized membrane protein